MAGMMCVVAGWMVSLPTPNESIIKKYTFLRLILLVHEGPGDAQNTNRYPALESFVAYEGDFWVDFDATLVPFGGQFGFGITMASLWSHFGYMKVRFQKTLIFPTDFNGSIKRWDEL